MLIHSIAWWPKSADVYTLMYASIKKTTYTRIIIIVTLVKMDSDILELMNNNYNPLVSGIEV